MFGNILKGMKTRKAKKLKVKKWGTFKSADANRWKKQGSVKSMVSFKKLKANKWWK